MPDKLVKKLDKVDQILVKLIAQMEEVKNSMDDANWNEPLDKLPGFSERMRALDKAIKFAEFTQDWIVTALDNNTKWKLNRAHLKY